MIYNFFLSFVSEKIQALYAFQFYFWCLLEVALNEYAEEEGTMVDKDTTTESPGSTSVTLTESTSVPMGESSVIVFVVGVVPNEGELPNKIQHHD